MKSEGARPSYFAPDLVVYGQVVSGSPLYVAGRVEGDVECAVLTLTSAGVVDGVVRASAVHLESGARLSGSVEADIIGVKGDASISGRIICRAKQQMEAVRDLVRPSGATRELSSGGVELAPAE
ncbi:MAG: polymer-forming cytoskeletal protein [Rhodospirillum sp.]|nr:polymer-forming cytoskeletal protein [Rhodospirillum sp.]MCF8488163.1 polymer-forming cytoskeletal protein [Rhodospirillum sp.]MCF8499463.1 polymer-forming cytoskeletal protein [Rhodospirillum sp.]